jgi:hypothetical protein
VVYPASGTALLALITIGEASTGPGDASSFAAVGRLVLAERD